MDIYSSDENCEWKMENYYSDEDCEWSTDPSILVKKMKSINHHVPLELIALANISESDLSELRCDIKNIKNRINLFPFSSLIGKRLFGVQPITECQSCKLYKKKELIGTLDLKEHDIISNIIEHYIHVPFWTEAEKKEMLYDSIKELAEDVINKWKGDVRMQNYIIKNFAENYAEGRSDYTADICPRLWLFVGDSVLSFETYLLFNSSHGHPHMDNWWLLEWKLSQPQATEKFKMIGEIIESISVHDINHNISEYCMRADYDKWLSECGCAKDGWEVPSETYFPILKIITSIKIIDLGTKWYFCHYPRSLYSIDDC